TTTRPRVPPGRPRPPPAPSKPSRTTSSRRPRPTGDGPQWPENRTEPGRTGRPYLPASPRVRHPMLLLAALYAAASAVLFVFGLNLLVLAARHHAQGGLRPSPAAPAPREWPRVTVQLPLYNERFVVERLIDAAARLDYPADRLEIQVLDDSTDATRSLARARAAAWRARGVDVRVVTRADRGGYKAG